jgi:hypothetical protein
MDTTIKSCAWPLLSSLLCMLVGGFFLGMGVSGLSVESTSFWYELFCGASVLMGLLGSAIGTAYLAVSILWTYVVVISKGR